ncbi:MAG: MmgE/PrpD family protein [Phycisphaerales bacterium]|nr:MmgE/PrpD family protein [Phycisphaerales bacterium]
MSTFRTLPRDTNQALGIAQYAIDFMRQGAPSPAVLERTNLFHTDATLCGLSALALGTNAPNLLRREAMQYAVPPGDHGAGLGKSKHHGATFFGSLQGGKQMRVKAEKAIVANCAAVREWDSNGTNFGYDPDRGNTAGEFGHNDFYPVAMAAAQMLGAEGATALRGMVCIDEIRGRLAEVFSLKSYKVDHVVHGAIGSAATFGAMVGATPEQIESAIGMFVAHHIPFRAIRAGKQLSDSKGSSAAISTEAAILCVKRSMAGFLGPRDIFRNPEAIFRIFEGPGQMFERVGATKRRSDEATKGGEAAAKAAESKRDASPFDLHLAMDGDDFTVMGMHFKLGLYEHQSAGALQAMITLLGKSPDLLKGEDAIKTIKIVAYEPAFGIIGDPAKRKPTTRQSADHSMVYIVATLLRKAIEQKAAGWTELMLEPEDYSPRAIENPLTRRLMDKIEFAHGGGEYDSRYPDGIPTSVVITDGAGKTHDSGLVMYPGGHARNAKGQTPVDLRAVLNHKFALLGGLVETDPAEIIARYSGLEKKSAADVQAINDFDLKIGASFEG